ncbi:MULTISPECIES: hypothetical protein [unclassified Paenibacillus]|uniref:hypothetical protein n=1 Tax=unclassified Paenibacillus TaxID=185978 RepID=UPI0009543071|nr:MULTISPECIES: hypothetical protein [unclassified Paenibacillus]ASS66790.1 hypothetical protein CIC07_11915 [Paenibacillus sp. RUD330]SIP95351.1 hypothetical protein SAMN05880555_0091 [Paenibacillus sp. RU4X]SIQ13860.1 hypothetical protein SAMN05880570_0091 [Paenibacillus sp. RU4T]
MAGSGDEAGTTAKKSLDREGSHGGVLLKRFIRAAAALVAVAAAAGCGADSMFMSRPAIIYIEEAPLMEGACLKPEEIRLAAWNAVPETDKLTAVRSWKEAPVTPTVEKAVCRVDFATDNDLMEGPIGVYVDSDLKIVGWAGRE